MGFVDRGGGREAKGSSLRRSKKNPGAAAARGKAEPKVTAASSSPTSLPPPPPKLVVAEDGAAISGMSIDCSVAYLSRKFEADRDRLCERSATEGKCGAIVAWCSEVERQEALLTACSDRPGQLYCIVGVHPDNIDRTNKKAQEMWLEQIERLGKSAECVGLLTGLNMMREPATHFAQEAMFKSLYATAARVRLPLVIHANPDDTSIEAAIAFLQSCLGESEESKEVDQHDDVHQAPNRIVFHNVGLLLAKASPSAAKALVDAMKAQRMLGTVSTAGLEFDAVSASIPASPLVGDLLLSLASERLLLLSSDSPWNTPQNITDEYLRTLHNDPANLPFVQQWIISYLRAAAACTGTSATIDEAALEKAWTEDALATFFSNASHDVDGEESDAEESKEGGAKEVPVANEGAAPLLPAKAESAVLAPNPQPEVEAGPQPVPIPNAKPDTFLSCVKCRARLFAQTMLVTHPPNAKRVTFQGKGGKGGGGGGSCEATLFISLCNGENDDDDDPGTSFAFPASVKMDCVDDSAQCRSCKCKLGTVATEASCPCGCIVPGTTARLVASRVEVIDTTASVAVILSRAAQEAEQLQQQQDDDGSSDNEGKKRQKKPKVNVKASNRSNFTNYRNKTFAAPSNATAPVVQGDESTTGKKKNKKGRRGGDSDSD